MLLTLGKQGKVEIVLGKLVKVEINGRSWSYHASALTKVITVTVAFIQPDNLMGLTVFSLFIFLVACTRLYKPLCRSVGRSVGRSFAHALLFFFAKWLIVSRMRYLWRSALFMEYKPSSSQISSGSGERSSSPDMADLVKLSLLQMMLRDSSGSELQIVQGERN